jgi:hypothetical protein
VNQQGFPFAVAVPFVHGQPYLGGELIKLGAGAANANRVVSHTLGRMPRFFWVLDVGQQTLAAPTPFPRGTTPWSNAAFSLSTPAFSAPVWGLIA